jgi:RNA polymerase sigma-70 factor, ECF subfamily
MLTLVTTGPAPDRDAELRALVAAREIDRATEEIIRAYGPELLSWLRSALPGDADAYDAFSWMSEDLWRSLGRYDARCSLRTWCYMLARHAAARIRRAPRRAREQLVSQVPSVAAAVAHVWKTSRADERRMHDVYAEIRATLPDEEQTLLVLRVDRDLAWRDIAIVLLGEDADAAAVTRKASTLRKQFERVKQRLRELAAERLRD